MDNIAILIHTRNEENNVEACIKSAQKLTHNIIVIDMESTDNTIAKVKKMNVAHYSFPFSRYVEPARGFGIQKVQASWIFIMDADERMTNMLANEINDAIQSFEYSNYKVPRENIFEKKKSLRHGGWYPDYQLRLIHKIDFVDWPEAIHSTPLIKGKTGFLSNSLLHYFHSNLSEMVKKTIIFEDLESDLLFAAKKTVSTATFFRKFFGELNRRLLLKQGFLDGTIGIIESIYQAFSKTITYIYLFEKYEKSRSV